MGLMVCGRRRIVVIPMHDLVAGEALVTTGIAFASGGVKGHVESQDVGSIESHSTCLPRNGSPAEVAAEVCSPSAIGCRHG